GVPRRLRAAHTGAGKCAPSSKRGMTCQCRCGTWLPSDARFILRGCHSSRSDCSTAEPTVRDSHGWDSAGSDSSRTRWLRRTRDLAILLERGLGVAELCESTRVQQMAVGRTEIRIRDDQAVEHIARLRVLAELKLGLRDAQHDLRIVLVDAHETALEQLHRM